jgi:hypothetical protein
MTSRRQFISLIPVASLGVSTLARSADAAPVDPADPAAQQLGFTTDAAKADKTKFPKYAAGQECGNCVLYQGAAGSASGPCPIFQNKIVPAKGWCSAYVKKG